MRRRALLTTIASGSALLAGCAAGEPTETEPGTDPATEPGTETPSPTPQSTPDAVVELEGNALFGASVVELDTVDRTYALSPMRYRTESGAEIRMRFDATATADHPARIVASVQNVERYPEQFDLDWLPPFGRTASEPPREHHERLMGAGLRDEGGLVLAPTDNHDLVDDPPAVERGADGYWRLAGEITRWLPETLTLDPGEAVRGEYAVVGHPEGSGRPTGVYEFLGGVDGEDTSITVWQTSAPGPDEASRFAGESVPAIGGDGEAGAGWYHTADASSGTYLRPESERAELPAGITFQFVNHTREELGCGHWYVYKLHDGQWFDLGPYVRTAECRMVPPAGTKSWTLHAYRGGGDLPPESGRAYPFLGGGRYAVSVGYGAESSSSTAMVELVGEPIEIVPTDGVEADRDGSTVRVTTPEWEGGDGEHDTTLSVTRAEDAEETLIREQVMRPWYRGLRNTLPFFEAGVDEVRLRSGDGVTYGLIGHDESTGRVRVDGQAYELSASGTE
ncbi:hypothetical protein [Halolamina rubra]|uniref:hypothetical protein n=1 Tax=Halolamina rubra TaxID=1380430 RepID=UPI000678EBCC|nr:hypothetical protein [Halolamina rubra]